MSAPTTPLSQQGVQVVGTWRFSEYSGAPISAIPSGFNGARMLAATAVIAFAFAGFGKLELHLIATNSPYQKVIPLGIAVATWLAMIAAILLARKKMTYAACSIARPYGAPNDARRAVIVAGKDGARSAGWIWNEADQLVFVGERFHFRLRRSDFKVGQKLRAKSFMPGGASLALPKGLTPRLLRIMLVDDATQTMLPGKEQVALMTTVLERLAHAAPTSTPSVFPPLWRPSEPLDWRRIIQFAIVAHVVIGVSVGFPVWIVSGKVSTGVSILLTGGMVAPLMFIAILLQKAVYDSQRKEFERFVQRNSP